MAKHLTAEEKNLLRGVMAFSREKRVTLYIVGGFLRDLITGREKENRDIDFALQKNAIAFGRALAKRLGAGFVILDKEHGCCRLVKKVLGRIYTLDFSDFRGPGIKEDLLHRDFTINTLALPLKEPVFSGDWKKTVIDLYAGAKDIRSGVIRVVNKRSFDEDPLRILRAFSLAAIFSFKIETQTLKLIARKKNKLKEVSAERVRDELFKILQSANAFVYLKMLDELRLLELIIPEVNMMRGMDQGPYHHLDILEHSFESVRQLERIIRFTRNKQIIAYLEEEVSYERKRRALLKLGAFLHDIGKPRARRKREGKLIFHGHERVGRDIARDIARRLRLSNDESDSLQRMIFLHLRPGYLADNPVLSPRARFRFFRDAHDQAISVLLLSLADQRSTRGPLTTRDSRASHEKLVAGLIREYFRARKEKKLLRLVNGDDLIGKFRLEPSILIGKILSELEELQAIGRIKTKEEALAAAAKMIPRKS
jgi:putative nucleotidyltransferase with HDIG domain